jgi:transposase
MTNLDHTDTPASVDYATIYVAFELSKAKWMLGVILPGSKKLSRYTITGGDVAALAARLAGWRKKAAALGDKPVQILSCYEAGFDGHWLHRWLADQGVINHEIDPSSIEVNRRARRAKTDRIDLERMMRAFLGLLRGEPEVCHVVHVPSVEDEDRKRRSRARERLLKERIAHTNRIKGLLHAQGVRDAFPLKADFVESLESVRTGDGRLLPPGLKEEIVYEHERLSLVSKHLALLETNSKTEWRAAAPGSADAKIVQLATLKGIGPIGGQRLVHEVFYRDFDNRRQVGSYIGLTGTPYNSGSSVREQGIGKAGNRRAREVAIEIAWLWLSHQPDSELSRWFRERVGNVKGRIRRIAIVALARKLMVALWRYLKTGVVPTGSVLRPTF